MTSASRPDLRPDLALFAAGLLVFGLSAASLDSPGYMDAEYYYSTGQMLASGAGFSEPFIWNFLAEPVGIPTPSHAYWMPLASLIAAVPMAVLGEGFRTAQIPFVLLAACLPVLTARTAMSLGAARRTVWLAGGLSLLPGFYLPYFVTTDTFAIYAVIGGAALWQIGEAAVGPSRIRWLLIGVLIGLGQLTRADGLLLWIPAAAGLALSPARRSRCLLLALLGYSLVVLPWWARNLSTFGSILPDGAGRALWLADYDDLFSYPPSLLTPVHLLSTGWSTLLRDRLAAAWSDLQTLVAVNGSVVLLPMAFFGAWTHRRRMLVRIVAAYGLALFAFMSIVFPFAGARGGFFHSSAALMPLVWAALALGIHETARLAPRLGWGADGTRRLFAIVAVAVATALSIWTLAGKAGAFGTSASFSRNRIAYSNSLARIRASDAGSVSRVAVVNPPGFYAATGVAAVALPNGDAVRLREVVERFGVDWIVLEADHPSGLAGLYADPAGLSWLGGPITLADPGGRRIILLPVLPEAVE